MPNRKNSGKFSGMEKSCDFVRGCGFEDPYVVLTVRRQDHFLLSTYKHYVHRHREMETFFGWLYRSVDIDGLSWASVIETVVSEFGRESVRVVPFEVLKTENILNYIEYVCGIPKGDCENWDSTLQITNPSLSDNALDLAIQVNERIVHNPSAEAVNTAVSRSVVSPPIHGMSLDTKRLILNLSKRYAEENERLRQEYFPEIGEKFLF